MTLETYAWLILLFPLAGTITIGIGFRALRGRTAAWIGTLAIAGSFVCSILTLLKLLDRAEDNRQVVVVAWNYAYSVGVDAQLSLLIDPLSLFMALTVSGVSTLIHLYSVGYMASDRGYNRFFSYLNFFVFSMLLLVLAGNFVILIVGWAFVGAASYLLISFWYRRKTATSAGIKAFVINVVGDVGLVLGTYFIFKNTGTVDFLKVFAEAPKVFTSNDAEIVAGCIMLLVGAFAKSAQIPLHTWLPDAMEGPTPVSALIHAATMVTAGVYLIARMHPLFELAPAAAAVGAIIGCATLMIAASIALVVTDLKRVIAYSTMSQIGYMIMAVSAGAYVAGMFHLMTHAFFKALLFMAAGSIIAAMAGNQNLNQMSGFRKALPFTFGTMVIGGLALAGVPPFAGFFSKDEILATIASRTDWTVVLVVFGYIGAFLTAIYTFRMICRAFYGKPCKEAQELEHGHLHHAEAPTNPATGEIEDTDVGFPGPEHHIAERTRQMRTAMSVLALLAIVGGILQIPYVTHVIDNFLKPTFASSHYFEQLHPSSELTAFGLILGAVLSLAGVALAFRLWVGKPGTSLRIQKRFQGAYTLFVNKWWFDEGIDFVFVRPAALFGQYARASFERVVITGIFVDGTSLIVRSGSAAVRAWQSGFLRYYAAMLLLGITGLSLYFLLAS